MVSSNWFKDLGLAGKISVVVVGGAAVAASAYGMYALYREATSKTKATNEASEEGEAIAGNSVPEKRILVLGLDGAGKSVFLSVLSQGDSNQRPATTKTEGFNVVCLTTNGLNLNIWEIGGAEQYRTYWPNFIDDTQLLIYVVDSSDPDRFNESRDNLKTLLSDERLDGVPLLLVASKQDIKGARQMTEVVSVLGINEDWASDGRCSGYVTIEVKEDGHTSGFDLTRQTILKLCK